MTTYSNKQEAQTESNKINAKKGFNISFPTFIGGSIASAYGLTCSGWYVQNKETKNFH